MTNANNDSNSNTPKPSKPKSGKAKRSGRGSRGIPKLNAGSIRVYMPGEHPSEIAEANRKAAEAAKQEKELEELKFPEPVAVDEESISEAAKEAA